MPDINMAGTPGNLFARQVTIAAGTAVSEIISTQGQALVGIIMPAAWTAANIGYQTCISGRSNDLLNVYDAGGNPSQTVVSTSRHIAFPTSDAIFVPFLALTSMAAGTVTPVNQVAAAVIILLFRNFLN